MFTKQKQNTNAVRTVTNDRILTLDGKTLTKQKTLKMFIKYKWELENLTVRQNTTEIMRNQTITNNPGSYQ